MQYKLTIALILVSLAMTAHASSLCRNAPDHATERACLIREAELSIQKVKAAQNALRKDIGAWDEEPYFKAKTLDLFNSSIHQFQSYRDTQCEYEASMAAGGNSADDLRLYCKIELDDIYLKALKKQAVWFSKLNG